MFLRITHVIAVIVFQSFKAPFFNHLHIVLHCVPALPKDLITISSLHGLHNPLRECCFYEPHFYSGGNRGTGRSSNMPKITQLVRGGSEIQILNSLAPDSSATLTLKQRFVCYPAKPLITK